MAIQVELNPALSPGEWLRRTREARGLRTDIELARVAGLLTAAGQNPLRAIRQGHRPTWRTVQVLARTLGVPVEEVVLYLWGEAVGDPCECQCGGEKVVPEGHDPTAVTLRIRRACGHGVFNPDWGWRQHAALCKDCTIRRPRSARWMFECAGWQDHRVTRHTERCRGAGTFTAPYVLRLLKAGGKGPSAGQQWGKGKAHVSAPPSFRLRDRVDGAADRANVQRDDVVWTCGRCTSAALVTLGQEKYLRTLGYSERINTGGQRREVLRTELARKRGNVVDIQELQPAGQQKALAKRRERIAAGPGLSAHGRLGLSKGKIVAWWSRPEPPKVIVYRCVFCRRWCFVREAEARRREYKLRGHHRCFLQWQMSPEGRAYYRGRREGLPVVAPWEKTSVGAPAKKDYRREFGWAIQNKLGKDIGVRQIAESYNVGTMTVSDGVHRIMESLPDPALVPKEFRRHIELLRASR